jgi:hypothetical protein
VKIELFSTLILGILHKLKYFLHEEGFLMKKEFKYKKTLALLLACLTTAASVTSFSAFAEEISGDGNYATDVTLTTSAPSVSSYTVTVPPTIVLSEVPSGDNVYAVSSGADVITVSNIKGSVDSVNIYLGASGGINSSGKPVIVSGEDEITIEEITLDGIGLVVGDSSASVTYSSEESKSLSVTTEEYSSADSKEYKGTLTFTAVGSTFVG